MIGMAQVSLKLRLRLLVAEMRVSINRFERGRGFDIRLRGRDEAAQSHVPLENPFMHRLFRGAVMAALIGAAPAAAVAASAGPFDAPSPLLLHAPRFDKIKDGDFQPAFEVAMARERAEIEAIADNPAAPTFDNTFLAMERSGRMLNRVVSVFFALTGANTDEALEKVEAEEAPKLSALRDETYLNPKLFARVKALYDERERLGLDAESVQLIKITYDDFVHAGAKLSAKDRAELTDINSRLASLQTAFQQKLLAATKAGALVVDNPAALAGLSPAELAAAAQAAKARGLDGKWVIPLQNTTQQPDLRSLAERATRKTLFDHSWTRAEKGDANDTRSTILEIVRLRARKAALIGYPDFAAYKLEDQMAKTPAAVEAFVRQLVGPARARAAVEAAEIQAQIDKDGGGFTLAPWDWERYSEEVRKAKYDLDENEIKPYFELYNVLENGVFYAANQLYGVTFKERHDLPVYQPDVKVFEVFDQDGKTLGLIYFDYFKRDNK
ncbi:MAG: M3 family metallopeptidase, partial [Caulobacteraceae bacterium]